MLIDRDKSFVIDMELPEGVKIIDAIEFIRESITKGIDSSKKFKKTDKNKIKISRYYQKQGR